MKPEVSLGSILSHLNLVYTLMSCLSKIKFIATLTFIFRFSNWFVCFRFSTKTLVLQISRSVELVVFAVGEKAVCCLKLLVAVLVSSSQAKMWLLALWYLGYKISCCQITVINNILACLHLKFQTMVSLGGWPKILLITRFLISKKATTGSLCLECFSQL